MYTNIYVPALLAPLPPPPTPPVAGRGLVIPPVEWGGVNEQIVSGSSGKVCSIAHSGGGLEHIYVYKYINIYIYLFFFTMC